MRAAGETVTTRLLSRGKRTAWEHSGDATDRFLAGLLVLAEWASDREGTPEVSTRDPEGDYLLAGAVHAG